MTYIMSRRCGGHCQEIGFKGQLQARRLLADFIEFHLLSGSRVTKQSPRTHVPH